VSFDPLAPYGPVIESTVRVVTWNVWGRFWAARQALLESAIEAACSLLGLRPAGEQQISDHYGVVADLRY